VLRLQRQQAVQLQALQLFSELQGAQAGCPLSTPGRCDRAGDSDASRQSKSRGSTCATPFARTSVATLLASAVN
jgi:hypothetical protein